ncbi:MAG: tyrosine-type recombinase/integrase [Thermodesulfobacteriota bacterium]|nr:tyrosine-type recombinase/integrase [Thermodesulfobacteriota bacterium]
MLEGHFALHNALGMSKRTIHRLVKNMANKAHISRPTTPHVLRHTLSVTVIQKGISTRYLQEVLGHSHLTTTEIYLKLSSEDVVWEFRDKR